MTPKSTKVVDFDPIISTQSGIEPISKNRRFWQKSSKSTIFGPNLVYLGVKIAQTLTPPDFGQKAPFFAPKARTWPLRPLLPDLGSKVSEEISPLTFGNKSGSKDPRA